MFCSSIMSKVLVHSVDEAWIMSKRDNFVRFLEELNERIKSRDLEMNIEKIDLMNLHQLVVTFAQIRDKVLEFDKHYVEICNQYGVDPDVINDQEKDKLRRYLKLFSFAD